MPEVVIKQGLIAGLRPGMHTMRDAQDPMFISIVNMMPSEYGFVPYETSYLPAALEIAMNAEGIYYGASSNWPMPQFFVGSDIVLLIANFDETGAHKGGIWSMNPSTYALTRICYTAVTLTCAHCGAAIGPLDPHTTQWHVAEFFGFWIMTNGEDTVFYIPAVDTTFISQHAHAVANTEPHIDIGTLCKYRGRLICGNFSPLAEWVDAMDDYYFGLVLGSYTGADMRGNSIWWSMIGGGDLVDLIAPEAATDEFVANPVLLAADAVWTLGAGWSYVGGVGPAAFSSPAGTLSQAGVGVTPGVSYKVSYGLEMTSADAWVRVSLGGTEGTIRSYDHWISGEIYKEIIRAGTTGVLEVEAGGAGQVTLMSVKPLIGEVEKDADLSGGIMPLPTLGNIMQLLPLKDAVIAYGNNNVIGLRQYDRPFPTLGVDCEVCHVGTAGRYVANGDEQRHLFVDTVGSFHMVGNDLKDQELGYRWGGVDLQGNIIHTEYDPVTDIYYISDSHEVFIKTKTGMGGSASFSDMRDIISTLVYVNGVKLAHIDPCGGVPVAAAITDVMDMGTRKMKTLTEIELGMEGEAAVAVTVHRKLDRSSDWEAYVTYPVDFVGAATGGKGVVDVHADGVEFVISVTFDDYREAYLNYIRLVWMITEKADIGSILRVGKVP